MRSSTSLARLTLGGLLSISASLVGLGACGDDGGATVDAGAIDAGGNPGFPMPTAVTKANNQAGGVWSEVGDADWTCLNTPSTDTARPAANPLTLTGKIRDFQTDNGVGSATLTAFSGINLSENLGMATSNPAAAMKGDYSINLAALTGGQKRYGFKIEAASYLRTYLLNQYINPAGATTTQDISAVSIGTANAVIAFVGESFDNTTGTLAGAFRDCQGREVSNAVATVSSTSHTATHLPNANTFYFSAAASSLPVRHNVAPTMNHDGLFVVIDLPPQTAAAYIQVWGFRTQAELTAGTLTLLSELPSPVEANAIITGSFVPLRQ